MDDDFMSARDLQMFEWGERIEPSRADGRRMVVD
jgi:hypothetical protein